MGTRVVMSQVLFQTFGWGKIFSYDPPPPSAHNVKSMHVLAGQEVTMCVRGIIPYAGMP